MQQPIEVSAIKVTTVSAKVFDEYAAQIHATDTIEMRSRIDGILQRQTAVEGARVKKNDLLFVMDQTSYTAALTQAKANLEQVQASSLNSSQNLERIRLLFAEQVISQQEMDAAIAKEHADAANVEAAKIQVNQAQHKLGNTTMRAPCDGIVGKVLTRTGGLVNASTTLLTTLYAVNPVYARFTIGQEKLAEWQKQRKSDFNLSEDERKTLSFKLKLIDGTHYESRGKLDFIDTAADVGSGNVQVQLSVPNPGQSLKPGQFVRVIAPAREIPGAILLPHGTVRESNGKHSVLMIGMGNKVVRRNVVAKTRIGDEWLVDSGLTQGELVVAEGESERITIGMVVKPFVQFDSDADRAGPKMRPW